MAEKKTDAQILFPDLDITLNGQPVTVRAFRFAQEMKALTLASEMIADFTALFTTAPEGPDINSLDQVFARHYEVYVQLISMSTGLDVATIGELGPRDSVALRFAWWEVNKDFFIKRVILSAITQRANAPSAGAKSLLN